MAGRIVNIVFSSLLFLIVFISPIKFGIPSIETNKIFFPEKILDWIFNPWPNELFIILIAALAALFFIKSALSDEIGLAGSAADKPIFIFCAAVVLSVLFSVYKNVSILAAAQTLSLVIFFYIALNSLDKKKFLLIALLSSAIAVSLYGFYQSFFGFNETKEWASLYLQGDPLLDRIKGKLSSGRVFSTFVYPNAFAGYLLTVLPLACVIFFKKFRDGGEMTRRRILIYTLIIGAYCGVVITVFFEKFSFSLKTFLFFLADLVLVILFPLTQAAAIFLSLSEGGIAVLIAAAFFAVYLFNKKLCWKAFKVFIVVLILLALALLIFNRSEFLKYFKLMSVKVRLEYMWSAFVMALHRPLFGFGPGTFGSVYAKFKLYGAEETQFAHNNFLQVFAESGIAAFIGFCLILIIAWKRGLRVFRETGLKTFDSAVIFGAFLGLTGFLLHSMIDFDFYVPAIGLNAFLLLAIILGSEGRKRAIKINSNSRRISMIAAAVLLFAVCAGYFGAKLKAGTVFKNGLEDFNKGYYSKALESFKRAGSLDKSNAVYQFQSGLALEKMERPEEALPFIKKAIGLNRYLPFFHYELAKCYFLLGGYHDIAEVELKEAVSCYPKSVFYRIELAKFFEIVGQKDKALIEYQKIRELDPKIEEINKKLDELER